MFAAIHGIIARSFAPTTSISCSAVSVKPSYGLDDEAVEEMLLAALDHGEADLRARRVAEHRVDAHRIVGATKKALVADADLLDAGVIFGTGFAPFRGGPIQYARSEGVDKVKLKLEQLAQRYGERFSPKNGWDHPALAQSDFLID